MIFGRRACLERLGGLQLGRNGWWQPVSGTKQNYLRSGGGDNMARNGCGIRLK